MSIKPIAATAAFSLSALLAGPADAGIFDKIADAIEDAAEDVADAINGDLSAVSCAGGEQIVTDAVDGVTHNWTFQDGYRNDAVVFAQAVTHNGSDAGAVRIAGAQIKFQESNNGNHGSGETVHTFSVCELPGSMFDSDGETGTFDLTAASQSTMHYVAFDGAYDNPVFFAQVATHNGSHPIVATPVLVDGAGAWVALMEPTNYDGAHAEETVHWMVMEAGSYQLDDGSYMTVGALAVTTDDYSAAGMQTVVPTVDTSSNWVQSDTEYCLENARIKT